MNPLLRLRYLLEYAALRLVWAIFHLVPARGAFAFGAGLGELWYRLDRTRRRVAVENVWLSGVAATPAEARCIARRSFRHFVGHLWETLRASALINASNWEQYFEVEGPPEAVALFKNAATPVLFVTAHIGCWEIAAHLAAQFHPLLGLARPMNNPYVQRFIMRGRFRADITLLPKRHAFSPDLMRDWTERRLALGMLMDQHAGRSGIWIDFLGRPAAAHTSPARLHLMTGHPLVLAFVVRTGVMRYRAIAGVPLHVTSTGDRERDIHDLTVDLNRQLEVVIRRYPEQYLWMHRRWRPPPGGRAAVGRSGGQAVGQSDSRTVGQSDGRTVGQELNDE